jgi:hypothetical protein
LETNSKDNIPQILRLQAELYFGNLRKATNALEKDERLMRGWSKLKIIKALAQLHRSKADLTYTNA